MQGGFLNDLKNAFNRPNSEHIQLIIINVVIFVLFSIIQLIFNLTPSLQGINVQREWLGLAVQPAEFIREPWTFITYMFAHDGLFHIAFNMLWLYWFGRILTEYLGGAKVVNLYVLGGLAGALLYVTVYPSMWSLLSGGADSSLLNANLVGASAGVLAVVFGTATLVPNYTVFLLFLGPVKIKYIALFSLIMVIIGLGEPEDNAGGELAHLAGIVVGIVYIRQLQKGLDLGGWIQRVLAFFGRLFKPRSKIKVSYKKERPAASSGRTKTSASATQKAPGAKDASQDEIDAILDKISEKGYESLSKEEKQKLFNASKR